MSGKVFKYVLYIVLFMLFWNLLTFLWDSLIEKTGFRFAAGSDLGLPFVVAAVTGYLLVLRRN